MDLFWDDIVTPPTIVPSIISDYRIRGFKVLKSVSKPSSSDTCTADNLELFKTQNAKYPTELQKTLLDFIVAYMLEEPNDMIDYAVSHFTKLQKSRRTNSVSSSVPIQYIQYTSSSSSSILRLDELRTEGPRRSSVFSETFDMGSKTDLLEDNDRLIIPKNDKQRARLLAAIKMCIIFNSLNREEMNHVVDALFERHVNAGDIIIREGDEGDNFYIIDKGTFEVYKGCRRINVQTAGSFGEMALLYNVVRIATIKAVTTGKLWVMNRATFRKILQQHELEKQQRYEKLLRTTSFFKVLNKYKIVKLVDAFETKYFLRGELIVKQDTEPDGMYVIESGNVALYIDHKDKRGNVIFSKLSKGQFFGDLALLTKSKHSNSIYADTDVKCAFIDAASFELYMKECFPVFIKYNLDLFGLSLDDEIINKLQLMRSSIKLLD